MSAKKFNSIDIRPVIVAEPVPGYSSNVLLPVRVTMSHMQPQLKLACKNSCYILPIVVLVKTADEINEMSERKTISKTIVDKIVV